MNNYIQIYKNVISDEYCDELIEKFESKPKHHSDDDFGQKIYENKNQDHTSYKVINLEKCKMIDDITKLTKVYFKYIEQYKKDCDIKPNMWPTKFNFEQFRLKRYLPNDRDQFTPHVDVNNHEYARRFLVLFIYLSNNERGETAFPQMGVASPCKKGSLIMFPPLWPWLHAGLKPINTPKYMTGSYLHYRKNDE